MCNSKEKIGEKIKKVRMLRGITQHDLAEKVGLTEKQISKIETGVHYPKFQNFIKILEVLGISMRDFDGDASNETNVIVKNINKILFKANTEELKQYLIFIRHLENIFKNK